MDAPATAPGPPPLEERPRPLMEIARQWRVVHIAVSLGVGTLVTLGYLTQGQGDEVGRALSALDVIMGVLVTVAVAVSGVAGAFRVARRGEQRVTPLSDPMSHDGRRLVPADVVQIAAAPEVTVTTGTPVELVTEAMSATPGDQPLPPAVPAVEQRTWAPPATGGLLPGWDTDTRRLGRHSER